MDNLSTAAQEAIEAARAFAHKFRHRRTGTAHLLVGLALNTDVARQVFTPQGIAVSDLRLQVSELVPSDDDRGTLGAPLTADAQTVIADASKLAISMDHEFVWPEHILLAITASMNDGHRVLVRCGADPEEVARLAKESLETAPKEPMDLTITDTSAGRQNLTEQATRTARVLVPRDHQAGREVVLQATVVNAPLEKNCKAVAAVLNDQFTWTELLSLPVSEWRDRVPMPDPHAPFAADALTGLADDLLARASRVLGA